MIIENTLQHDLQQGSQDWHEFRAKHYGASEAAAMLGMSRYTTRAELLHIKATGITKDVDAQTQRVFDRGHAVEALARPIVEELIGTELFPVTLSKGKISASCDGLSMCDTIAWENKQFNKAHFKMVSRGDLPEEHWPQVQQVLYVSGAEKLYFTVSDGTIEGTVGMWVYPDIDKINQILAGWDQFEIDLANYVPTEISEQPKAEPIKDLPAITVQVRGELTLCNLNDVTPLFDKFLQEAKTNLVTDDDFAQAEAEAKLGRETAKRCKLTAKAVVDQMLSVSEVTRTLEDYAAKFDALALKQEKAVKEQKEMRKTAAKLERDKAYAEHIAALNAEIAPIRLSITPSEMPDFIGAMKGQRTLSSLYNKLDTELARAKIAADAVAKDIRGKLSLLWKSEFSAYQFLFNDLQSIIYKPLDDFRMILETRIEQHKKAEAERLERERERIRQEEETKARRESEAKVRAEQEAERKRIERVDAELKAERDRISAESKPKPIDISKLMPVETIVQEGEKREPCTLEIIDPIENKIKALELRIEAGDMNIYDALMVAYRIGLEQGE